MRQAMPRKGEAGQASVEYLVVAVGMLIALVVLATIGGEQCIDTFGGETSDKLGSLECKDVTKSVGRALTATVEELTFLINLPF